MQKWEYKIVQLFFKTRLAGFTTPTVVIDNGQEVAQLPWTLEKHGDFYMLPRGYVDYLNLLGDEGWEVIEDQAPAGGSFGHFFLLKRPKVSHP